MGDEQWVKVYAPATVANVGPGYDVLGLAVARPGDEVWARPTSVRGVSLETITGDNGRLPRVAELNVAGVAAREVIARAGWDGGVILQLHKGMPIGSGLGSSSASAVAAAWATNLALGRPLEKADLLDACRAGEKLATGAPHADNVVPCLMGGIALIRSYSPFEYTALPVPEALRVVVVSPELEVKTAEARAILPRAFEMGDVVANLGNVATFVSALHSGDLKLLGRAVSDRLVEPYRGQLIRGFEKVKQAALDAGALGCSISGSGPSMFALTEGEVVAQQAGAAMCRAFSNVGVKATAYVSSVNATGATSVA